MKKLLYVVFFGLFFPGFMISVNGQILTGTSNLSIEKEIDAAFLTAIQAAESFDVPRLINCVDDRYRAGFISNEVYFPTFDSLAVIMKARTPASVKQHITIQKKKISVISVNVALVSATGVALIESAGTAPFSINFYWTFVYQKINNEWKVIQSHQSRK